MTGQKKQKLEEKDFLFDIRSSSCKVPVFEKKTFEQNIDKLSSDFAESQQRKKLLRL